MHATFFINFRLLLVFYLCFDFRFVIAGICWSNMKSNGQCTESERRQISKENCCSDNSVAVAWSPEDLDDSSLFFWTVLGGGVSCSPCKDSCEKVKCEVGKTCAIRKGIPKCICASKCKGMNLKPKGPVCGTDGRSYKNICRLKKRSCRRKTHISVAYTGVCQSSCDRIICPHGQQCLLDQNLNPNCVFCTNSCPEVPKKRQVCGSDGETYASQCHLKAAACRKGKAIPLAYKGPCQEGATCSRIKCKESQVCLTDLNTGYPRCATCGIKCKPRHMKGPICGSNNSTYYSWCHMMQESCNRGFVIETKHSGQCNKYYYA